nr:AAA domain-containing protein [Candidatus Sigynarchaeum springense]
MVVTSFQVRWIDAFVRLSDSVRGILALTGIDLVRSLCIAVTRRSIKARLDMILPGTIPIEEVEAFKDALVLLSAGAKITLAGTGTGGAATHARYAFTSCFVSPDLDHASETAMTIRFLTEFHALLTVANITEARVRAESPKIPGWFVGPDLGIFYWGEDQLDNVELMLQRHIDHLIASPVLLAITEQIIDWFAPSASEVVHAYQHKKIYDLKSFAQMAIGLPCVINYTWQDVARSYDPKFLISNKYWIPHYDYFDYHYWHEYIDEKHPAKKAAAHDEIVRQIEHKMHTLNSNRYRLQGKARASISVHSRPVTGETYRGFPLGPDYHGIAHVWYMFSRLNGSVEQMDADFTRTIFPDRAIGNLDAARITVPTKVVNTSTQLFHFTFSIPEQSSNVRVKEGDLVLVIPEEKRDMRIDRKARYWTLLIDEMDWNHALKGFDVTTKIAEPQQDILAHLLAEFDKSPAATQWYLYPWANDPWSDKLFKRQKKPNDRTGLLQRLNLGTSWLGMRLSWLWDVRMHPVLTWPASWMFDTPEVYMYAPELLRGPAVVKSSVLKLKEYHSDLKKDPDDSQLEAINKALHEVLFGIQGPPGTGKSQTIVTLMNEYHVRRVMRDHMASTKILITAFSYAAMRVLVQKVLESEDKEGNMSVIGQFQLVFVRSDSQEPVDSARVDDLVRHGNTWVWNAATRRVTRCRPLERQLQDNCIIFANAHSLFYLPDRLGKDFAFDMVIVDEASQLPPDYFLASLQFIKKHEIRVAPGGLPVASITPRTRVPGRAENAELTLAEEIQADDLTRVVIVGDYNQLPPVQPVKAPDNLVSVLNSLFSYYVLEHGVPNVQLEYNHRSNEHIVEFTREMGIYVNLKADLDPAKSKATLAGNATRVTDPWLASVLSPPAIVETIIHDRHHEKSVSNFEAELVSNIVLAFYEIIAPANDDEEINFWKDRVGIVSPHNAQCRVITRKIYDALTGAGPRRTLLPRKLLMSLLKMTISSVEKFQGSDRELIIASYDISDRDQIAAEEDFIYDLNRFNVLTSRAKHKCVVICSRMLLSYIATDRKVMTYAEKLHSYAFQFCENSKTVMAANELGGIEPVEFRWHGHGTPVQHTFKVAVSRLGGKVTVAFPADPQFLTVFRALPGHVPKRRLPSPPGTESWEFDERDLHAIKAHVPVPPAWLRNAPAQPAPPQPIKPPSPPKRIKRGVIGS